MERTLTPDERIRRAEEIYYRKKIQADYRDTARVNVNEKPNFNILRKMFFQIAICILIYCSLHLIKTTHYVFSGDVIVRAKEILSHDIDFNMLYSSVMEYINGIIIKEEPSQGTIEDDGKVNDEETTILENENGIGGANTDEGVREENSSGESSKIVAEDEVKEDGSVISDLSEMELDAKEIRENYSIKLPLKGTITSRFGNRNPTTPSVPKYHTGIDIAVNEGTVFVAAMEGTVTLVSGIGDFRESHENN